MTGSDEPLEASPGGGDRGGRTSRAGVTIEEIHSLVKKVAPAARDLTPDSEREYLKFWYEDQDADLLPVNLYLRPFSLEIFVGLNMDEGNWMAVLEAANEWNWSQNLNHSGFPAMALERHDVIFMRSVLPTDGELSEGHFEEWINNFLESINPWEDRVFAVLQEWDESDDTDEDDEVDGDVSKARQLFWYESDRLELEELRKLLVTAVPAAHQASVRSDRVSYVLPTDDGGSMTIDCLQPSDDPSLFVMRTGFGIEGDVLMSALAMCNGWNTRHYPHDTVSYVDRTMQEGVPWGIFLESSMFLNKDNSDFYFDNWANGFVESAHKWRSSMLAGLLEDQPKGEPFLAKVGAGLAAVTPFIAKAAQVLGEAFLESMADDIRGKGKPAQRNRSGSTRNQQRSGQYRQRSSSQGRQQRRPK